MNTTRSHAGVSRQSDRRCACPRAGGFTLAELVIVSSLIGLIVMGGGTLMWQVSGARLRVGQRERVQADADAAIQAMVIAIANAYRPVAQSDGLFVGMDEQADGHDADSLRLLTVSHKVVRPGDPESDVHEVEFRLAESPDGSGLSLTQRTDPTRNVPDDEGGVVDRIAGGLVSLDFEYFDGITWQTRWPESMGRLPAAVRITASFADTDRPVDVTTITRLVSLPHCPDVKPGEGGRG